MVYFLVLGKLLCKQFDTASSHLALALNPPEVHRRHSRARVPAPSAGLLPAIELS